VKQLQTLHEEFIGVARRPMNFDRLPVKPIEGDVAIVAVEKWKKVESPTRLRKTFKFSKQEARNRFIKKILAYEDETQHNAMITIDEGQVTLDVRTKDIDQITELDKEYARYADVLYKDTVYNPVDE